MCNVYLDCQAEVLAGAQAIQVGLTTGSEVERLRVAYHVGKDAVALGFTPVARTQLVLGSPLAGYAGQDDRKSDQRAEYREFLLLVEEQLFDKFGMCAYHGVVCVRICSPPCSRATHCHASAYSFFRTAYMDSATAGTMQVRWFARAYNNMEFVRMSTGDVTLTATSIAFVFAYIWLHTGSLWLTATCAYYVVCAWVNDGAVPCAAYWFCVVHQPCCKSF